MAFDRKEALGLLGLKTMIFHYKCPQKTRSPLRAEISSNVVFGAI